MITTNDIGREVYFLLLEVGFNAVQAQYITAQAAHETQNFSSSVFKNNNNCFGMRLAKLRNTTAKGEKNNYAYFDNLQACIKDFSLYYKFGQYLTAYSSLGAYVEALKKRKYFEAAEQEYLKGCAFFYNLYFGEAL